MDLRLADEPNPGSPAASRSDNFTVALLEQRGSASKNDVRTGLLSDAAADHINLQLVLGDGDDSVLLKQTTGSTTVLGGDGNDTLTSATTRRCRTSAARFAIDGAAHIDEVTSQVGSISDLGIGANPVFPLVYANSAGATPGHPILSLTDANGHVFNYQSPPDLKPIVFVGSDGKVHVYSVALRPNGTIIQDYVQELGVPELDANGAQVYIDSTGAKTMDAFDATTGFPNTPSYIAEQRPGRAAPLRRPDRLDADPDLDDGRQQRRRRHHRVRAPDRYAGLEHRRRRVSNDPTFSSFVVATRDDGTPFHVPGDNGASTAYMKSFRIGGAAGATYKYVRVRSTNAFQLDAIGIIPGHGGPQTSSATTAFPTAIQSSSMSSVLVPGAAGAPNGTYVDLGGQNIVFKSIGLDTAALISVNRVVDVPLTKTVDVHSSFTGDNDQLIVDGSKDTGIDGTLDSVPVPFDQVGDDGAIVFSKGTATETLSIAANATTVTLAQPVSDGSLLTVIAKRALISGDAVNGYTRSGSTVTLGSAVALGSAVVVQLRYDTALGVRTQTFSGNATRTITLVDVPSGSLFTVTVFEVISANGQRQHASPSPPRASPARWSSTTRPRRSSTSAASRSSRPRPTRSPARSS